MATLVDLAWLEPIELRTGQEHVELQNIGGA